MSFEKNLLPSNIGIALGANIPYQNNSPINTLILIRPLIEELFYEWLQESLKVNSKNLTPLKKLLINWSPLYKTKAIGSDEDQPDFINAAALITGKGLNQIEPNQECAELLLKKFLALEKSFDRRRDSINRKWGPRTIDIDFLFWGELHIKSHNLTLPHPRALNRSFVLIPLLDALNSKSDHNLQLPPQKGWD